MLSESLRKERIDRKKEQTSWHISSIGMCPAGVFHQRKGIEPEFTDRQLRIFRQGEQTELFVKNLLGKYLVEYQPRVEYPDMNLTGYADFIVEDERGFRLIECKSQNSKAFWWREKRGGNASEHHVIQTSLYWNQLKEKYKGLEASVLYVSKDDLCMVEIPLLEETLREGIAEGFSETAKLNEAWEKGKPPFPTQLIINEGTWRVNWKASFCPVHHICTNDPDWKEKAKLMAQDANKEESYA